MVSNCSYSFPSSLEDHHLKEIEVHQSGWYMDTAMNQVEQLAPAVYTFIGKMRVGQKVTILDTKAPESKL